MRVFILFILCFFLIVSQNIFAQMTKKHYLGSSFGIADAGTRDLLVSPLAYKGKQLPFQLSYQYRRIMTRHRVRISYASGSLQSSVDNTTNDIRGGLQYEYHRYFTTLFNNDMKIFAGFIWNNNFSFRSYKFRYLSGDNISGELIFSLNLSLLSEYQINSKNEIDFQIFIPFLAYIFRPGFTLGPPDEIADDKSLSDIIKAGDSATINKYFQIRTMFSYKKNLSSHLNLEFEYQFMFYQFQNPRKTSTVVNQFDFGVVILF